MSLNFLFVNLNNFSYLNYALLYLPSDPELYLQFLSAPLYSFPIRAVCISGIGHFMTVSILPVL